MGIIDAIWAVFQLIPVFAHEVCAASYKLHAFAHDGAACRRLLRWKVLIQVRSQSLRRSCGGELLA